MTRIALVDDGHAPIAAGLRALGHDVTVLRPRALPLERWLRRRGFTEALSTVPATTVALRRGSFDVVHVFTPADALSARLAGAPVVYTERELLDRGRLADARLRLTLLQAAVERSDALLAASVEARDALRRWLAVDARVIDPRDAEAHARVYAALR